MDDQPGRLYVPPTPVQPEQREEARRSSADPIVERSGRVPAAERELPPSSLDPDIIEGDPSTRRSQRALRRPERVSRGGAVCGGGAPRARASSES